MEDESEDASRSEDLETCNRCGFPIEAEREMVLIEDSIVAFSRHMREQCGECGHYRDGSTIIDKDIRTRYGGPPKIRSKGGWFAEIQEGRKYNYDGREVIEVVKEDFQTEERGRTVKIKHSDGELRELNYYGFKGMLQKGTITPVEESDEDE